MNYFGIYSPYLGGLLLMLAVVMATYFLLWGNVEIKRIIAFTVIISFCGAFFMLYERMTELELSGLGKIKVQAIEDAGEIKRALLDVKLQRDEINSVVEDANSLRLKIDTLESEFEREKETTENKILISKLKGEISELTRRKDILFSEMGEANRNGDLHLISSIQFEMDELYYEISHKQKRLELLQGSE